MSDAQAQIRQVNEDFAAAFERGDFEAVASFYTEDALFLPTGRSMARGRQAIRDAWAAMAHDGLRRVKFESVVIQDYGEIVLELAVNTGLSDSPVPRQNYYVIAWKRQPDGVLRLHWDIVTDIPPARDATT